MASSRKAAIVDLKELKLEEMPYTLKEILASDVFCLPARKMEDKTIRDEKCIILGDGYSIPEKAYQELYGKDPPIWGYKETPEEKSKKEKAKVTIDATKFTAQFAKVLDGLITWGKQQGITTAELKNLNDLKTSFFKSEYSSHQTAYYFTSAKQALEKIWYILAKKDDIPTDIKISKLNRLSEDLGVCDSGSYTNLIEMADELTVDRAIEAVLSKLRRNIADTYAALYCQKNSIYVGNQIHISTALYAYQATEGWGPIVDISKIKERYDEKFTYIDEYILTNFHEFFTRSYTPKVILDCICTHCESEMKSEMSVIDLKQLKADKDGWMPYNQPLMNAATKVASYVGGEHTLFVEYNSTNNTMRFNPHLLRANFLKFCQANNKFFQKEFWETQELTGEMKDNKFHQYLNSFEFSWIETPDGQALNCSALNNYDLGVIIAKNAMHLKDIPNSFNLEKRLATMDGVIEFLKGLGPKNSPFIKELKEAKYNPDFLFDLAVLQHTQTKDFPDSKEYQRFILDSVNKMLNACASQSEVLALIKNLDQVRKNISIFNPDMLAIQLSRKWHDEPVSDNWIQVLNQTKTQLLMLAERNIKLEPETLEFLNETLGKDGDFTKLKEYKELMERIKVKEEKQSEQMKSGLPKFLELIAFGKQAEAEKMLEENPKLLLMKGTVTDYSGRKFEPLTGYQLATWALDWRMRDMCKKYLDKLDSNEADRQLNEVKTQGVVYKISASPFRIKKFDAEGKEIKSESKETDAKEITVRECQYDFAAFLNKILKPYIDNFKTWSWDQRDAYWCQNIGWAQRFLPTCITQEYCQPGRPFSPNIPDFSKIDFVRVCDFYDYATGAGSSWFPLGDSKLGFDFGILRDRFAETMAGGPSVGGLWRQSQIDFAALTALNNVLLQKFPDLKQQPQPGDQLVEEKKAIRNP